MNFKKVIKFIIYVFGPLIGSGIISIFVNFKAYNNFNKPPLSPPGILFPIVWSILYILMGISFYIINKDELKEETIKIFITQLIVNYAWSFLFFNFKSYLASAIWIVLLISLVIRMIITFKEYNKISAYMQIPYLLWLLFALYLNIGVFLLN